MSPKKKYLHVDLGYNYRMTNMQAAIGLAQLENLKSIFVRRTKQIVEIVGIDPNSMEIITNEVFRWNVTNDDFIFSGKSYVLEKIMVKINYSQDEMRRELRTRKRILEWMVLNDIRKADQVSQIITEYYVRPHEILARVDGLR